MSLGNNIPLVAGERLDRATFHERYEHMPPNAWAELIGGVVHVASRVGFAHGETHAAVAYWIAIFDEATPGVRGTINSSTILDDLAEPQPDVSLLILPEYGGQSRLEGGYLAGAPELIVEVAESSLQTDLGPRLLDYERTGVLEYVVVALEPDEVFWFARRDGRFTRLQPDGEGLFHSEIFPGLWLDAGSLYHRDLGRLDAALGRGLASTEHAGFIERLARVRG